MWRFLKRLNRLLKMVEAVSDHVYWWSCWCRVDEGFGVFGWVFRLRFEGYRETASLEAFRCSVSSETVTCGHVLVLSESGARKLCKVRLLRREFARALVTVRSW
jgi:hypothetical protein